MESEEDQKELHIDTGTGNNRSSTGLPGETTEGCCTNAGQHGAFKIGTMLLLA